MKNQKKMNSPIVDFAGLQGLNGLGDLVSVDQLIGKSLYAKSTVKAYYDADKKKFYRTFAPGQPIGQVFSYVLRNSSVIWQIEGSPPYYVAHDPQSFDFSQLQNQGTLSLEDQKRTEALKKLNDRSTIDKITDSISSTATSTADAFASTAGVLKTILPVAVVAGIALIGISLYKNVNKLTK